MAVVQKLRLGQANDVNLHTPRLSPSLSFLFLGVVAELVLRRLPHYPDQLFLTYSAEAVVLGLFRGHCQG